MNKPSSPNSVTAEWTVSSLVRRYRWTLIWCAFHFCALVLSYSEVKYFNNTGEPREDKFWPFVKFTYPTFLPQQNETYVTFNGFFTQYDWTEFAFYIGVVLFSIIITQVYRRSDK